MCRDCTEGFGIVARCVEGEMEQLLGVPRSHRGCVEGTWRVHERCTEGTWKVRRG